MSARYTPPPPSARYQRRLTGMRLSVGMRDVRSVYLGGNITRTDWRRSIVTGLSVLGVSPALPTHPAGGLWPILPAAVLGLFDYVGPYSISGDRTDDGEWNSENADEGAEWVVSGPLYAPQRGPRVSSDPAAPYGRGGQTQPSLTHTTASQEVWWPLVRAAREVKRLTLDALLQANLYFAWLDTPMCASTLTEIGWAQSYGKILWLAGPQAFDELWLAYTMADQYSFRYPTPADAFQSMLQLAQATRF